MLVVDDLHAADPDSIELLRYVATVRSPGLVVIAALSIQLVVLCFYRLYGTVPRVRMPVLPDEALPRVLVQLQVCDEGPLAVRVAAAAARLDWPKDKLEIQVLDDGRRGDPAEVVRNVMSVVPEGVNLTVMRRNDPTCFKAGNLAFGLRNYKVPKSEIDRRVREAAKVLELDALLKRKPRQLSGGQRQRVALGRAIVREPKGFLMDEPLSNLDAALRVQTRTEILKLQKRLATTTLYVTHDQVEAMTMGDRIAVMNKGRLQQIGTPEELYEHPANTFVAGFIGSPAMNVLPSSVLGIGGAGQLAGFRPEHVQLDNGRPGLAEYQAAVDVVEYLGDEQLAYLKLGDHELVIKLPVNPRLQPGQQETFYVPLEKVMLFDEESSNAVGSAA